MTVHHEMSRNLSPLGLFGARAENGCWGYHHSVSILRFWQNVEKESFFFRKYSIKKTVYSPEVV